MTRGNCSRVSKMTMQKRAYGFDDTGHDLRPFTRDFETRLLRDYKAAINWEKIAASTRGMKIVPRAEKINIFRKGSSWKMKTSLLREIMTAESSKGSEERSEKVRNIRERVRGSSKSLKMFTGVENVSKIISGEQWKRSRKFKGSQKGSRRITEIKKIFFKDQTIGRRCKIARECHAEKNNFPNFEFKKRKYLRRPREHRESVWESSEGWKTNFRRLGEFWRKTFASSKRGETRRRVKHHDTRRLLLFF